MAIDVTSLPLSEFNFAEFAIIRDDIPQQNCTIFTS
jgi:hypothetical protein